MASRVPGQRRWLRGASLAAGVLVAGLVVAELALRASGAAMPPGAWGPRYLFVADPELGIRPRPGFTGRQSTAEFDVGIEINREGCRGPELEPVAEEDLVVLVVSDSFGFGYGVEGDETLAARLQVLLRERLAPRRVQVINAGVSSYGQRQMALQVRRIGARVRPDIVLATFLFANDFADNLDAGFTERGGVVVRPASARWIDEHPLLDFSLRHSDLMLVLTRLWLQIPVIADDPPARTPDPMALELRAPRLSYFRRDATQPEPAAWEALEHELAHLHEASAALGAPCVLIDIAFPFQIDERHWQETCARHGIDAAAYDLSRLSQRIAGLCSEQGIEHLDLAQAWKGRSDSVELFFPFNLHWTRAGQAAAAETSAQFLRERGWL